MSTAAGKVRVALGADHGGFHLKEAIKGHLARRGVEALDCGTNGTDAVDYPVFARAVAERVAAGQADLGIMVDRAGIGSSMAANKVHGIRAALCYDLATARNSREHNNANVLTLGAGLIGADLALQIVDAWLDATCTEERHLRRAAMIEGQGACGCGAKGAAGGDPSGLSGEDLERVARRMAELAGVGSAGDAACMMCRTCVQTSPEFVRELVGAGAERVVHSPGGGALPLDVARYIDHTLLRPEATAAQVEALCREAADNRFASVCVNPNWVRLCAARLAGTPVKVCTVVGFPLGAHLPEIKALEARRAIREGAREIDMVINVGALKGGDDALVLRDIRGVVDACVEGRAICKVILETALLDDAEKVRACRLAKQARAHFVKTSTGFGPGGATAHDVALMADAVRGAGMGVKAAGGIRSFADAEAMIRAGATRLGASAGVRIVQESRGVTVAEAAASGGKY